MLTATIQIQHYTRITNNWPQIVRYILLSSSLVMESAPSSGEVQLATSLAGARICRIVAVSRIARSDLFPAVPVGTGVLQPDVRLPVWLPSRGKGAGIRTLSCAPSRTRTYGLLLRRQCRSVARQRRMWPDVPSRCTGNGWMWPGVARCRWSLAPRQAPRVLVSNANVGMFGISGGRIKSPVYPRQNTRRPVTLVMGGRRAAVNRWRRSPMQRLHQARARRRHRRRPADAPIDARKLPQRAARRPPCLADCGREQR